MNVPEFLYNTVLGRMALRVLISRPVSDLFGHILDSRLSGFLINPFIKKNHIRTQDYILDDIESFNDFFCRRIKKGLRPVNSSEKVLIAPCDGLLSVYEIDEDTVLTVKNSSFTIKSLLRDSKLAGTFKGGYALVFRLCVDHYHRYVYFDSGKKYSNRRIEGVYHTVRPVALSRYPVFKENTREYTVMDTDNFGRCVQMEVGAMLVGRIVNEVHAPCMVKRGEEKGHFEYGGSTVIILIPENAADIREDILSNADSDKEIPVVMGERIGEKCSTISCATD